MLSTGHPYAQPGEQEAAQGQLSVARGPQISSRRGRGATCNLEVVSEAARQAARMKDASCAYGREEKPSGGGQGVGPLNDAIGMTRAGEDEREDGGWGPATYEGRGE